MRLVQLAGPAGPRVGVVEEPHIRLLAKTLTMYGLVTECLRDGVSIPEIAERELGAEHIQYDPVYRGHSDWKLDVPIAHPVDPARCLVSGTGLTHKASVANRDAMHTAAQAVTDSTRMYEWGLAGGRPEGGKAGVSPEWFYKGSGSILRALNEPLTIPPFAEDGGEEPEIAGVYVIDDEGAPVRIGFAAGNEFSDHLFERRNYLYLASSKLRECSIGPELVTDPDFGRVRGEVRIERGHGILWKRSIHTGEEVMCHSLANIEHHHFKFEGHRRPGDLHVHFFGADAFSFGEGIQLEDGDVMQVQFEGFGRALRNPVRRVTREETPVPVKKLGASPGRSSPITAEKS